MDNPPSVLVIDDEADIRDGIARRLAAAGYRTLSADNGLSGVEIARRKRPDAILLDVLMPVLDGMEALARLRADARTSDIPVTVISASLRDERRALDAGARCFIRKPFDGRAIVETVHAVVRGGEG